MPCDVRHPQLSPTTLQTKRGMRRPQQASISWQLPGQLARWRLARCPSLIMGGAQSSLHWADKHCSGAMNGHGCSRSGPPIWLARPISCGADMCRRAASGRLVSLAGRACWGYWAGGGGVGPGPAACEIDPPGSAKGWSLLARRAGPPWVTPCCCGRRAGRLQPGRRRRKAPRRVRSAWVAGAPAHVLPTPSCRLLCLLGLLLMLLVRRRQRRVCGSPPAAAAAEAAGAAAPTSFAAAHSAAGLSNHCLRTSASASLVAAVSPPGALYGSVGRRLNHPGAAAKANYTCADVVVQPAAAVGR